MLFKQRVLAAIAEGQISLAFRRWKRPTVKSGGQLRTPVGVLAIDAVDGIDPCNISDHEATLAGYESRDELLQELNRRDEGRVYRIVVRLAGADPRATLRQQADVSDAEFTNIREHLGRMDARSRSGPWAAQTLEMIARHPGRRAPELAETLGMETQPFKRNVRKLKELGLTESLKVGYRLSPRGEAVFSRLQADNA